MKIVLAYCLLFLQIQKVNSQSHALSEKDLTFINARIYPSPESQTISNGIVIIKDDLITYVGSDQGKIPKDHKIIDCKGQMSILSGFYNSHVHFSGPKWNNLSDLPASIIEKNLTEMLTQFGYTFVVDLGSFIESTRLLKSRIESGEVKGPFVLTAGSPLFPENGIPNYLKSTLSPDSLLQLKTPATSLEALNIIKENIKQGADVVKIFTDSWVGGSNVAYMSRDIADSVVMFAHRQHLLVFAHQANLSGLDIALKAHVDVTAHATRYLQGWDSTYLKRMTEQHLTVIPTLNLFRNDVGILQILDFFKAFKNRGGSIIFGTDTGDQNTTNPVEEYLLMSKAGMNFQEILASLTTTPAALFGQKMSGRLNQGMKADMAVVWGDPAQNIRALASVAYTIRDGKIIYHSNKTK